MYKRIYKIYFFFNMYTFLTYKNIYMYINFVYVAYVYKVYIRRTNFIYVHIKNKKIHHVYKVCTHIQSLYTRTQTLYTYICIHF